MAIAAQGVGFRNLEPLDFASNMAISLGIVANDLIRNKQSNLMMLSPTAVASNSRKIVELEFIG